MKLYDTVRTQIRAIKIELGMPEYLILDRDTYEELRRAKDEHYWPQYTQADISKGDLYYGLQVAVSEARTTIIKVI